MPEQLDGEFVRQMHEKMASATMEFKNGVACMSR